MAIPTAFEQSNAVLSGPPGHEVGPLSIFQGTNVDGKPVVVSCWKLTSEELEEIIKTKRIWVVVMGRTHPPICICGTNQFEDTDDE